MVYVLNIDGHPIMPTNNHAKIRILLKQNKAKIIKRCPFTIQLLYKTNNYIQSINLGVDSGSKYIGLSATNEKNVLYEANVELRNDIVDLLATRRECRRIRRNKKTRYRKPRFNNRIASKKEGWLAPSIKHKIDCHLKCIADIYKILPIQNTLYAISKGYTLSR